jgi:hypothetical protein
MNEFVESRRSLGHITNTSNTGLVTPSKYDMAGRLRLCACGVETKEDVCAVCRIATEAGIDLRVFKG